MSHKTTPPDFCEKGRCPLKTKLLPCDLASNAWARQRLLEHHAWEVYAIGHEIGDIAEEFNRLDYCKSTYCDRLGELIDEARAAVGLFVFLLNRAEAAIDTFGQPRSRRGCRAGKNAAKKGAKSSR
jgi:hypothetical protein